MERKVDSIVAGKVTRPAKVSVFSPDAGHNELATKITGPGIDDGFDGDPYDGMLPSDVLSSSVAATHTGTAAVSATAGRTDAPVLVELARLVVEREEYYGKGWLTPPEKPGVRATMDEWKEYGLRVAAKDIRSDMRMEATRRVQDFVSDNIDAIRKAVEDYDRAKR